MVVTPIVCPWCNTKNDFDAKFCNDCSLGLDEKSIMDYDHQKVENRKLGDIETHLIEADPRIKNLLISAVQKVAVDRSKAIEDNNKELIPITGYC